MSPITSLDGYLWNGGFRPRQSVVFAPSNGGGGAGVDESLTSPSRLAQAASIGMYDPPYYDFLLSQKVGVAAQSIHDPYYDFGFSAQTAGSRGVSSAHFEAQVPQAIQNQRPFEAPSKPLTAVHVAPFFLRGGAEQWLLDILNHLDRRYVNVTRCIGLRSDIYNTSYMEELASRGVSVEIGGAESVQEAARECDVLLSWGVCLDELMGATRAPLSVQVVHGDGPMNRHFLENSRNSVDHATAVSHRVQAHVCGGFDSTVIYNGIDAARIAPQRPRNEVRRDLGFDAEDFVVGFVGRFAAEKRIHVLLEAVSQLPENFKVLLVGFGRLHDELKELAGRILPGRCVITQSAGDLGDLYRAMDATCLTSDQEGFSMVMLEAMLAGRPFVSTPVGSAPEILTDRVNGLLIDGSPESLAAALSQLAAHPEWACSLAKEGQRTVEQFGYARRMARDYEYLLHRLWRTHQGL